MRGREISLFAFRLCTSPFQWNSCAQDELQRDALLCVRHKRRR